MTLADDVFAPVTSVIGFLKAPLYEVAAALQSWRATIHGSAWVNEAEGGLAENIHQLEPLTAGIRPRELAIQTQNAEWTAIFDCGLSGGDPVSTVGYLAEKMHCQGVVVCSIPHTVGLESPGRYGALQFELFGPLKTDFLNYVRTISLTNDGSRWRFDANGTVQDFEDTTAYMQRSVSKRFSEKLLNDYCSALGLDPFSLSFYSGPSVLVSNPSGQDHNTESMSISGAQTRLGIKVRR